MGAMRVAGGNLRGAVVFSLMGAVALSSIGCASGGDDDGGNDGPKVPFTPGDPIDADPMTWQYVHFPGTKCRDGQETGLAININPDSNKLVFYFEGGGACFNTLTCAMNPTSWGESDVRANYSGVLDRNSDNNPFKDWNMVYVPYCTGDVFSGTTEASSLNGEPMQGYTNVGEYLERVVPTFPNLDQVVLSGSSAGGFGAAWNWMRTQDAFGDIPVYALDDSGPPFGPDYFAPCLSQQMADVWGWDGSIHPACTECDVASGDVVEPLMRLGAERSGSTRFGLLSNDEDGTIKLFFSFGLNECASPLPGNYPTGDFPMGLAQVREESAPYDNVKMWVKSGSSHTFLIASLNAESEGVALTDWITDFINDAPSWDNVFPAL